MALLVLNPASAGANLGGVPREGQARRGFNQFLTMGWKCRHYNSWMPDAPLRIATLSSAIPGRRVLKLDGPLTLSNFFEFQNLVRADHAASLIVDLSGVPYIDSAGIGSLVNGYVSHQNAGQTLSLVGVTDRVRTSLRIANVEQFFPIFSNLAEAEQLPLKLRASLFVR